MSPVNNNVGMTSLNKTRPMEWLLACCAIAWGFAILQPGDLFEIPSYRLLGLIMRETTWGALAILIGCMRCLGLGINGWWKRSPIIRALGSYVSGFLWLSLCILQFAAAKKGGIYLPAGVYFYLVFFVFEGWALAAAGYDMQKNGSLSVRRR